MRCCVGLITQLGERYSSLNPCCSEGKMMGLTEIRKRELRFDLPASRAETYATLKLGSPPALIDTKVLQNTIIGAQETASTPTGFPASRRLLRRNAYDPKRYYLPNHILQILRNTDWGSSFSTTRNYFRGGRRGVSLSRFTASQGWVFNGSLLPGSPPQSSNSTQWPKLDAFDLSAMHAAGATAIARTIPTNPIFDGATFLGELREGIPRLPGLALAKGRKHPKDLFTGAGDEWLNLVFGWVPTLSDAKDFSKTIIKFHDLVKTFEEQSGQNVYRKYEFPPVETTSIIDKVTGVPPVGWANGQLFDQAFGTRFVIRKRTTRMWFSACYTFYLHAGSRQVDKLIRDAEIARKLYSAPDLGTIWNLLPYSWAVDWFSNSGDIITNLSRIGNDGLVIRWAYIMRHDVIEDTHTLFGISSYEEGQMGPISATYSTESKQRVKATPYGFGLNLDTLSAKQLSIMAALGITRGR